ILTPTIVATPLAIIALAFIPVGAYLYHANNSIGEITFDYTHCSSAAPPTFAAPAPGTQSTRIAQWQYDSSTSTCSMLIDIGWDLPPPVFMYISLTQFYQNHRLYIKSHSTEQTGGKLFLTAADITGECSWLRYANCDTARNVGTWTGSGNMADMNPDCRTPEANRDAVVKNAAPDAQYFPCGLIANSVFSDDISPLQSGTTNYTLPPKDISWPEDLENYANSPWFTDPSLATSIPTKLIPPPGWRHKYPNGYTATEYPNFATDERLQVWLRKAGFPHFRKLWGKNPDATLPKGVYRVDVVDRFQVRSFGGTKSIILSTLGPLGSRDGFLGITFLVVGCIAAFAAFLVWAVRFRKLGDRSYLSWNAKNQ
ncbi:CDC50/LEM3 family, partial [Powellomyces hirtus]